MDRHHTHTYRFEYPAGKSIKRDSHSRDTEGSQNVSHAPFVPNFAFLRVEHMQSIRTPNLKFLALAVPEI